MIPSKKGGGRLSDEILSDLKKGKAEEEDDAADDEEGEEEESYAGDEEEAAREFFEAGNDGDWPAAAAALKSFVKICGMK